MKSYISQIFNWCPLFVVLFCCCCCWCCCRCCSCCCLYHFYRSIFVSLYLIKSKFFQFYVTLLNSGQFFILCFFNYVLLFYFIFYFFLVILFYFIFYFFYDYFILFCFELRELQQGKGMVSTFFCYFFFFLSLSSIRFLANIIFFLA